MTAFRNFTETVLRETGIERLALWLLHPARPNRIALCVLVAVVVAYVVGSVWMTIADGRLSP